MCLILKDCKYKDWNLIILPQIGSQRIVCNKASSFLEVVLLHLNFFTIFFHQVFLRWIYKIFLKYWKLLFHLKNHLLITFRSRLIVWNFILFHLQFIFVLILCIYAVALFLIIKEFHKRQIYFFFLTFYLNLCFIFYVAFNFCILINSFPKNENAR